METGQFFRRMEPSRNGRLLEHALRVALVAVIVGFSMVYFNNTYPISEGWGVFNAELMNHGKVPYRDFYFYLPPLSLWMDALMWKLSFGLLFMYRVWRLVERIAIFVLVYNLLKRYFHCVYAFIGCAFTAILATGDTYDLFGDYNQTMALLAILLLYSAIAFVNAQELKKKLKWLFICGCFLGGMFLNKQTIFLASFICYFICLGVYCLRAKDAGFIKYCVAVALGILAPLTLTAVYLLLNGALMPFIEQVFLNTDGKGSLQDIIINSLTGKLFHYAMWVLALFPFALGMYARTVASDGRLDKREYRPASFLLLAVDLCVIAELYQHCFRAFYGSVKGHYKMELVMAFGILLCVGCAIYCVRRKLEPAKRLLFINLAACLGVGMVLGATALSESYSMSVHAQGFLFLYIQNDFEKWCLYSTLILFILSVTVLWKTEYGKPLMFFSCAGFSLFYAGIMAANISAAPAHIIRIALPLVICAILSLEFREKLVSGVVKGLIWATCIALSVVCISEKNIYAYGWWGSAESPRWEETFETDIPALKGFRFSQYRKELYEFVTNTINENADEDAVVWGYPHIRLFNILTNRYNMDTFVPVLFPDVVSDKYVLTELEMLREHLPDIVVWETIPSMLETHEGVFRKGEPLKQREVEAFFAEKFETDYTLLGSYDNVYVYKKDPDKKNRMPENVDEAGQAEGDGETEATAGTDEVYEAGETETTDTSNEL